MIVNYDELFEKKLTAATELLMENHCNEIGLAETASKYARLVLLAAMKIEAEGQHKRQGRGV